MLCHITSPCRKALNSQVQKISTTNVTNISERDSSNTSQSIYPACLVNGDTGHKSHMLAQIPRDIGDTAIPTFPKAKDRQENQPAALRMWKYYERL